MVSLAMSNPPSTATDDAPFHVVGFVSNTGATHERDRLLVPKVIDPTVASTSPEYVSIAGFRASRVWLAVYALLCVATVGILVILTSWWPQIFTYLARVRVKSLTDADVVLLRDLHGDIHEYAIHHVRGVRWFEYKKQRYIFDAKTGLFDRVPSVLLETCYAATQRVTSGLPSAIVADRVALFGENAMALHPTPLHTLLLDKVVHPFYLFQLISVALWLQELYYAYAFAILAMSLLSILYEVVTQVTNAAQMEALVQCNVHVQVKRDGVIMSVPATALVVGDIVLVEEQLVPADMVLLSGECIADESSLTGEAIPVTKQHVTNLLDSVQQVSKTALLFSGSTVLRAKGDVYAVVTRTGFSTSKGELFRQILYPDVIPFQMVTDSYRYLAALSLVAALTSMQRIYDGIQDHSPPYDLFISVFDLISTTIPAALPMILTVGVGFSLTRLQRARLFCIDAQKINVAGHLNCFCFDKTGTLTSDRLHFLGVDACDGVSPVTRQPASIDLEHALAACHGLTVVDGALTGYSLELDMFAVSNYTLNANHELVRDGTVALRYVQRYSFDAALQRSSVVVVQTECPTSCRVFVKGSPEAIADICCPDSLPTNYADLVHTYASQGLYCMGLAMRNDFSFHGTKPDRASVEQNAHFLGFLLFENPIKLDSPHVIQTLEAADIDVRIITGDNALTAVHVARELSMQLTPSILYVDVTKDGSLVYQLYPTSSLWLPVGDISTLLDLHFNMMITGVALEEAKSLLDLSSPDVLTRLVQKTKIFARIKPQLKTWIVQRLMATGLFVGMTGDGTNDCGALKAAHVGLALSDAEASIVAPFTSRDKAIGDVVTLIREGRCALTTSLLSFKFMVMYPIIETTMVAVLNHVEATFSDTQYLFDDLILVLGVSVFMLQTPPAPTLTKAQPPHSLFAPVILWSVAGQALCFAIFFSAPYLLAQRQPWFCALPDVAAGRSHCYTFHPRESGDMTAHSYEVSIVWLVGHLQYIILAIAFNLKDPFRESAWRNRPFVLYTLLMASIMLTLLLWPGNAMGVHWFDLTTPLPLDFCWLAGGFVLLNLIAAVSIETTIRLFASS
ncbi:Aste57867_8436 [Aphanomyces stellatus]|uniref:Cation-transporting ATPase n=1 Tax=Aphanomyces stellatus TaxID=120398 RepID=A0A485KKB2_9STRA|nr:hypothetical protein As57867_008404 [Aphanomyces stellatus]VFT85322.1 Aste57867_8436 [Aphanomyces stellatus]